MSRTFHKVKYGEVGAYGSTEERFLYVKFDNTSDYVEVLDDKGNTLFSFIEWSQPGLPDLGDAIIQVLTYDNLQEVTKEEIDKIFYKNK